MKQNDHNARVDVKAHQIYVWEFYVYVLCNGPPIANSHIIYNYCIW